MTNLTTQRQVSIEDDVRSGDHLEAAKKAGYKDTHTLRNQACKLRRECTEEITDSCHQYLQVITKIFIFLIYFPPLYPPSTLATIISFKR